MNQDTLAGLAWDSFIGGTLAMPVHWYDDRAALHRDSTTLHRTILGPARIHFHQFLQGGENTLNLELAKVLIQSLIERGGRRRRTR